MSENIEPSLGDQKVVVEEIYWTTPRGTKKMEMRVYEFVNGRKGKMIEQHFFGDDDVIEQSSHWHTMTWEDFCTTYRDEQ